LIRVQELAAGYGNKTVFSRLSFYASREYSPLVLAGKNGSGKSTLLRILGGFQKPDAGSISFEKSKPVIAWLPQHFRLQLEVPVSEFVAMACEKPARWLSSRPVDALERSMAALDRLGIQHLAVQKTNELSGGEWQLVCLAQMLVQEADVWLLDEPTSSLDIGFKKKVFDLLWQEAEAGKTIVISTHDIPFLPGEGGAFLLVCEKPAMMPNLPSERQDLMNRLESI
jgi:ABC-type Mn2+/Zn2+ transport system ATPase subunit